MHNPTRSRIAGAFVLVLGLALVAWIWHDANSTGRFSLKLSILGPIVISTGLWLAIEGPELPARKMSPLGWVLLAVGLAAGGLFQQFLRTGRLPFLG